MKYECKDIVCLFFFRGKIEFNMLYWIRILKDNFCLKYLNGLFFSYEIKTIPINYLRDQKNILSLKF